MRQRNKNTKCYSKQYIGRQNTKTKQNPGLALIGLSGTGPSRRSTQDASLPVYNNTFHFILNGHISNILLKLSRKKHPRKPRGSHAGKEKRQRKKSLQTTKVKQKQQVPSMKLVLSGTTANVVLEWLSLPLR